LYHILYIMSNSHIHKINLSIIILLNIHNIANIKYNLNKNITNNKKIIKNHFHSYILLINIIKEKHLNNLLNRIGSDLKTKK